MTSQAVVITGARGAGKSSVAERLATLLEIAGVEFGALESEQFGWGSPWLSSEQVARQLRAVFDLQREAGRTTFLVVATAETDQELAAVIDAIAADQVTTVLLVASADAVAARVDAREPDSWPGKESLIAHARHLAVTMPCLNGIDIRVDTAERDVDEAAADVFRALQAHGIFA